MLFHIQFPMPQYLWTEYFNKFSSFLGKKKTNIFNINIPPHQIMIFENIQNIFSGNSHQIFRMYTVKPPQNNSFLKGTTVWVREIGWEKKMKFQMCRGPSSRSNVSNCSIFQHLIEYSVSWEQTKYIQDVFCTLKNFVTVEHLTHLKFLFSFVLILFYVPFQKLFSI